MSSGFLLQRSRRKASAVNTLLALAAGAATLGLVLYASRQARHAERDASPPPDYSDRSGWPEPAEQMRGKARGSFDIPRDMREPEGWR